MLCAQMPMLALSGPRVQSPLQKHFYYNTYVRHIVLEFSSLEKALQLSDILDTMTSDIVDHCAFMTLTTCIHASCEQGWPWVSNPEPQHDEQSKGNGFLQPLSQNCSLSPEPAGNVSHASFVSTCTGKVLTVAQCFFSPVKK